MRLSLATNPLASGLVPFDQINTAHWQTHQPAHWMALLACELSNPGCRWHAEAVEALAYHLAYDSGDMPGVESFAVVFSPETRALGGAACGPAHWQTHQPAHWMALLACVLSNQPCQRPLRSNHHPCEHAPWLWVLELPRTDCLFCYRDGRWECAPHAPRDWMV